MPIYEYQCAACGRIVEKWQKLSEPPLTVCPQCGGSLSKLISHSAFHLKGSGWYVSDYASKPQVTEASEKGKEALKTKDSKEAQVVTGAADTKEGAASDSSLPAKFK